MVLFAIGNLLWWPWNGPEAGARATEIVDFYRDTSDRIIVGGSLSLLAIAAFVVFAAALRQVLTDAEGDDFLSLSGSLC